MTINKVQTLLKDGLRLSNIDLKSVERKESSGKYPGLVIVETEQLENKLQIMKNKKKILRTIQTSRMCILKTIYLLRPVTFKQQSELF